MKILITGSRGFIGSKLMSFYPDAVAAPSLRNITEGELRSFLKTAGPDVIIHTAAVSDMPACEKDPEGSYRANVLLPLMLARCSGGAKLILFSSDQVYNASTVPGPYREGDELPGNTYAKQKLEMEHRVLDMDPNAVMLRAEWMYDCIAPKGNYFLNVLGTDGPLTFSRSQYRGVTYAREVAENMDAVIGLPGGAYNFGSETDQSMYAITRDFLRSAGRKNELRDCPPGHNLWMDCSKARAFGVCFSTVPDGLRRCLHDSGR